MEENTQQVDLTSVRTLVKSVSKLAKAIGVTQRAIYRWIEVDRIPGAHIVKVAQYYDVELVDLIPLTGSDKVNRSKALVKKKDTLSSMLEVYRGKKTLEEACEDVGIPLVSGKLILTHWGDELPTLHTTLKQLHERRISLDTAMKRLKVKRGTIHDLRRKYGFAPRAQEDYIPRPDNPKRATRNEAIKKLALEVISGRVTAIELARSFDNAGESPEVGAATDQNAEETQTYDLKKLSYRTIFRHIQRISHLQLQVLAHWPSVFREAYAFEIGENTERYAEKWVRFAEDHRLVLSRKQRFPKPPENWARVPLKRLLLAVLMGELTLSEAASSKGKDAKIFADLFTSDLRPLGLTFEEAMGMSITHQVALAEVLLAVLDRRRKFVGVVK